MKSNSYNRVTALVLWVVAVGLIVVGATAVGQTQGRRTRDRFTRPTESNTSRTTRPVGSSVTRATIPAESNGAAKPAEPNVTARGASQGATPPAPEAAPAEEFEPDTGAEGQQTGFAAYTIIRQRNIFSRNRRGYEPRRVTVRPPDPDPETYHVLRGVVQENNEFIAFIENTQDGIVLRKRQSDSVADRGTLKSIGLDSIEYQFGDKTVSIKIGNNLQGERGAVGDTSSWQQGADLSGSTTSSAQTDQSSTSSSSVSEIEKRLMEQRRQQLGQ